MSTVVLVEPSYEVVMSQSKHRSNQWIGSLPMAEVPLATNRRCLTLLFRLGQNALKPPSPLQRHPTVRRLGNQPRNRRHMPSVDLAPRSSGRELDPGLGFDPTPELASIIFKFGHENRIHLHLSLIHISEPTRLLSISYAVFCLKKKKI
eukprot:TRINITY_DN29019_c0_g2_i2.p1 TRINITY_DN29019_c0_g2~~TRINITY_DN29019_c0_g2_i2.p1  ORF type:complete len:149 (+),score=12.14 TRINITY_DN29019_c0_g2_i2:129-575(+)